MNAIEIQNLSKTFRGKGLTTVEAVKGLSLPVAQGEVFGFLGPNGAGKSTTIKIVMGLIKPSVGHVQIMGMPTSSYQSRKRVGYLPENPSFYDYLNAWEYLTFVGRTFGMSEPVIKERVEANLKLLDLWEARVRPIRAYSKGMVQRLGLAQALIHDPDVYILDEPMSGLDPIGRALVKEIILKLRANGKCVFFSTHITSDVEAVCDRVGVIVDGTLQCVEKVDTILTEGIVGYAVHTRKLGAMQQLWQDVPKAELLKFMADMQNSGTEITLIEPKRKNLEAFFLDIVKGKKC
jgi:ABC-2 type transport system ATP-binding protein